jgi:hypothetical protein
VGKPEWGDVSVTSKRGRCAGRSIDGDGNSRTAGYGFRLQCRHGGGGGAFKGRRRSPWHVGVSSSVSMHGGRLERRSGESLGWAVATRFGGSLSKETSEMQ